MDAISLQLIDLSVTTNRRKEEFELFKKKNDALYSFLNSTKAHDKAYFDYGIEFIISSIKLQNKGAFVWNENCEGILNDKLIYLDSITDSTPFHKKSDILLDKYYCRLQLEQKTFEYKLDLLDKEYISLLKLFIIEVPERIKNEPDAISKIDIEIKAFYVQDNITQMKDSIKIQISAKEAELYHAQMVKDYKYIIELLSRKMNLLKTKIITHDYKGNCIEKVDDELEVYNLKWNIESKKKFSAKFHERKNIN